MKLNTWKLIKLIPKLGLQLQWKVVKINLGWCSPFSPKSELLFSEQNQFLINLMKNFWQAVSLEPYNSMLYPWSKYSDTFELMTLDKKHHL